MDIKKEGFNGAHIIKTKIKWYLKAYYSIQMIKQEDSGEAAVSPSNHWRNCTYAFASSLFIFFSLKNI